ncbi:SpoIIE family protein phosphatase [Streptomyces flaveus]|uniref:SpoIIE family protein phosphatase n=1 Tax=Streptomyces flaveus TaxID=66370 RepID=UPI0033199143
MERLPTPPGEGQGEAQDAGEPPYTATATIDDQGFVTGWSEEARRLLGYTPAQVVGFPAAQLLADDVGEQLRRAAAGQERLNGTVTLRRGDGHRLQLGLLAHHRRGSGGTGEWLVVCAVADPAYTFRGEAPAERTFLQAPCAMAVFDTDLRLMRANAGMEDALSLEERQMLGLRLPEIAPCPANDEAEDKMRLVVKTGQSQQVKPCLRPAGVSAGHSCSATLAPLRDPDGQVRAVCLAAHHESQGYLAQERTPLLNDADADAGTTVDITTRARTTTMTLQSSLLPQTLPDQAALEVASRYLPAATRAGLGGDWFDVIPLSGARVALVVGDVVGHGIRASATMGQLRTAVRTLAEVDLPPDELLTHLDDLVLHLSAEEGGTGSTPETAGGIGTTCLYAVYDPVSRHCTLARAGHPPPAVAAPNGTVYLLDVPAGPPLGLGGLPFETLETELPEGSLLVLYTDGLLQPREHDIDEALDNMFTALARPATQVETVCDSVLAAVLTHRPDDDVALLIARTRALHADKVAVWNLASDPAIVAQARRHTTDQLAAWRLDDATLIAELIVSELVTNAIRYGRPPIQLRLIHEDNTLISEVFDSSSTAPHLRRARLFDEGGRGLLMVAQLAHRWGTRHGPLGKTIWAEQFLAAGT